MYNVQQSSNENCHYNAVPVRDVTLLFLFYVFTITHVVAMSRGEC